MTTIHMPPKFQPGTEWDSADALKHQVSLYAISEGFPTYIQRRSKTQFDMRCKNEGCTWRVYASRYDEPCFVVKILVDEHKNCPGVGLKNIAADSHFIANIVKAKLKEKPDYAPSEIRQDINRDFRVNVSYDQAFRAKQKATNDINGTPEEGYAKLPEYLENLCTANPGSFISFETTGEGAETRFKRLFISFAASATGFTRCKPLLGLDGTHLRSKYGGILLAATALDARGRIFPYAIAVVNAENDENWDWFLRNVHNILEIHPPSNINTLEDLTFLSDRQKGLLEAVGTWFPGSPHGWCLRHLVENLKTKFKHPKLAELLWKAARATTVADFDDVLCQMREINSQCVIWLEANAHPRHWATVYFRGHRWGHLTSNISESLNFMLNKARDLPCQPMLEIIRETMMDKWTEGREYAAKHQDLLLVIEVNSLF